jgi:DNA-binding transcriptional LysR family regulator
MIAAPSHALANRSAMPDQLRDFDFYTSDTAGNYHHVLEKFFETAQLPPPRTQALGTIEGVKRGVLANGNALGLLPSHAVIDELSKGTLAEVRSNPPLPGVVLRAVCSADNRQSPLIACLTDSLRNSRLDG